MLSTHVLQYVVTVTVVLLELVLLIVVLLAPIVLLSVVQPQPVVLHGVMMLVSVVRCAPGCSSRKRCPLSRYGAVPSLIAGAGCAGQHRAAET